MVNAVNMWYAEHASYNYSMPALAPDTGHFTQLVWRSTREIGAGNVAGAFMSNVRMASTPATVTLVPPRLPDARPPVTPESRTPSTRMQGGRTRMQGGHGQGGNWNVSTEVSLQVNLVVQVLMLLLLTVSWFYALTGNGRE
jgi:hypothetical protein